ncbi:hypothetical protein ACWCQQ_38235 [Streptomyces sp. NPDC002143]
MKTFPGSGLRAVALQADRDGLGGALGVFELQHAVLVVVHERPGQLDAAKVDGGVVLRGGRGLSHGDLALLA